MTLTHMPPMEYAIDLVAEPYDYWTTVLADKLVDPLPELDNALASAELIDVLDDAIIDNAELIVWSRQEAREAELCVR